MQRFEASPVESSQLWKALSSQNVMGVKSECNWNAASLKLVAREASP